MEVFAVNWKFAGILMLLASPVMAAPQTDVGTLTCTLAEQGEKDSNPDSQSKTMHCAFKPKGAGPEEIYVGEIKKVGAQNDLTGKRVLIWAVIGPADRKLKPAVLEQTYVGEEKPASEAQPTTAKVLVGESDKAYGLQPFNDQEHEAMTSRTVTVIQLRIKSTPT
jgi:hypothetical protein